MVLDAIPAEARAVVMPEVPLGASPVELPDPLLEPVTEHVSEPAPDSSPRPETFADRLADLAELLHGERVPYTAPRIFQESAAPGPRVENGAQARAKTPVIVDVTFHEDVTPDGKAVQPLLAAPPSLLLLAEPQPPSVAQDMPIEAFQPKRPAARVRTQQATEAEPSAPSAVLLPDPPNRGMAPALASLQDYTETAERLMRPADCDTPTGLGESAANRDITGSGAPAGADVAAGGGIGSHRKGRKTRGRVAGPQRLDDEIRSRGDPAHGRFGDLQHDAWHLLDQRSAEAGSRAGA